MKRKLLKGTKQAAIRRQLRELGLNWLDMLRPETFYIGKVLHDDEKLLGAACGQAEEGGSALLVVTDLRIIYLNQIPLFTNMDEVRYDAVDAVSSEIGRLDATVSLHTGLRNFTLHGVNVNAATRFVESVERVSIDYKK